MTSRYEVCPAADLQPGDRRIVEVDGKSIGVFNVDGEYHALKNVCPHQLAPLCEGQLTGVMESDGVGDYRLEREGEIVRCPWHGWKFDIETGESMFNPHRLRTKTYDVGVEPSSSSTGVSVRESTSQDRRESYGAELEGDEPPVETYPVEMENEMVVLYI